MLREGAVRQCRRGFASIRDFKLPSHTTSQKKNLLGFTLPDLHNELAGLNHVKKYTALQIWQHMYKKGYTQFDSMPNLSKDLRLELSQKYEIKYGDVKVNT